MTDLLLSVGLAGEPIDWQLVSQHSENGDAVSVFEADSTLFDRTYHANVSDGPCGYSCHYVFS